MEFISAEGTGPCVLGATSFLMGVQTRATLLHLQRRSTVVRVQSVICEWRFRAVTVCIEPELTLNSVAGVPEPFTINSRESGETVLLAINKSAFQEIAASFPGQLEVIQSSLLKQFGLAHDGSEAEHAAAGGSSDEGMEHMRQELKVQTDMSS